MLVMNMAPFKKLKCVCLSMMYLPITKECVENYDPN